MSEVQLVRLVSGEEVLAKIEHVGEATSFDKPHIIIPTQGKGHRSDALVSLLQHSRGGCDCSK